MITKFGPFFAEITVGFLQMEMDSIQKKKEVVEKVKTNFLFFHFLPNSTIILSFFFFLFFPKFHYAGAYTI